MPTRILTVTLNPTIDISAAVDRIEPARKLRCDSAYYEPGGGGVNVARVVRELGGEVSAFVVAGGATGRWLSDMLAKADVPAHVYDGGDLTRSSFHITERSSGKLFRFVLPGPTLPASQSEDILAALATAIKHVQCGYLVVSGSLPPGMPDDLWRRLADLCRAQQIRLVADTSGAALHALVGAGIHIVKPDRPELENLRSRLGWTGQSIEDTARGLIANGTAEIVVVTLGADGALLVSRQLELRQPAPRVDQRSPVGAGDSFVAALVLALAQDRDLSDAFRLGMAAGAAAVITPGTGLACRADVERLYQMMEQAYSP